MEDFKVGDIVFFTKEYIEISKRYPASVIHKEIAKSLDVPFLVVAKEPLVRLACPLNANWGDWQGVKWEDKHIRTWSTTKETLERRDSNTISLYDLNRGLCDD